MYTYKTVNTEWWYEYSLLICINMCMWLYEWITIQCISIIREPLKDQTKHINHKRCSFNDETLIYPIISTLVFCIFRKEQEYLEYSSIPSFSFCEYIYENGACLNKHALLIEDVHQDRWTWKILLISSRFRHFGNSSSLSLFL